MALLAVSTACSDEPAADDSASETSASTGESGPGETETGGVEDPMIEGEDFSCILDWPKVRRFRVTNVLGDLDATLAVAEAPEGVPYPVGSLIQLIPSEAMLKRAPGFSPGTNDWEYFSLDVSADGTMILDRGGEQVAGPFGAVCNDCHSKALEQWDFICEQDHGCDPLPLTQEQIDSLQQSDPRCP